MLSLFCCVFQKGIQTLWIPSCIVVHQIAITNCVDGEIKTNYQTTYNSMSCFKLSMSFGNSWLNAFQLKFLQYVIIMQLIFSIRVLSCKLVRKTELYYFLKGRTYKLCNCVNIDIRGKGLVRKLFDRSNDVNAVRLVNTSLGNVPCSPNRDIFLKHF